MTTANEAAIQQWGAMSRADIEDYDDEGDFAKRHLLNARCFACWVRSTARGFLDAGCGQGYFSRLLAARGASVVGVEPGRALIDYARKLEAERNQEISYVEAQTSGSWVKIAVEVGQAVLVL